MTIDPDIRDQAYQFFIEEASELLDTIETGLLNLRPDVTVQKVHEIMRAAHSIKGGAASVELNTIKTIAHRLEDSFKALYSDTVVVDSDLETLLLRAYDCLRHPLQSQINTGAFNEQQALAICENIFSKLEDRLGPALNLTDSFIPSAADLGVDIVASIFEVDVAEVITNLNNILANPQNYDCGQELQTQIEILTGFAELVDIPEFIAITDTAQIAANRHVSQPIPVIEQVLNDIDRTRTSVLTGNKAILLGPSEALLTLAEEETVELDDVISELYEPIDDFDLSSLNLDTLEKEGHSEIEDPDFTSSDSTIEQIATLEDIWSIEATELLSPEKLENRISSDLTQLDSDLIQSDIEALADVWGDPILQVASSDVEATDLETIITDYSSETTREPEANSASPDADLPDNHLNDINEQDIEQIISLEQTALDPTESAIRLIENVYDSLPQLIDKKEPTSKQKRQNKNRSLQTKSKAQSTLSAKVSLERLEHMDNLVGELAINRNSLSLHNHQFQRIVRRLGQRFSSFQVIVKQLQTISDQILVSPNQQSSRSTTGLISNTFDSLEMDSYGEINSLLEGVLEDVFQLAESIDDVALFAGQSNQLLERQRRTLTQLRDELMWSRMVPLNRVLNRFPRVIRELSNTYQKPVQLKLTGTDVLVDRVMLEKLYDPLLHLLRNAFDHGIESPESRRSLGKSEQGTIEIRAYHQGNHTVIEIEDDGQGIDIKKVVQRAIERQLVSSEQVETMSKHHLQQLIFEPGFSTAETVSELSGRGIGLDVVKASLQTFNGKLSLTTNQGQGTLFSLKIPLTLTLTKLVVGSIGTTAIALTSDSIEEILRPANHQLKQSGGKRFLHWRSQLLPVYELDELLSYQCQVPEHLPQELQAKRAIKNQQKTMLIIQQGQEMFALSLEQVVTEQELVIKPMGKAIAAPSYINGCTVLADGSLVPVIDGAGLVHFDAGPLKPIQPQQHRHAQTLMIVDDSSALRRTLALTLHKAGYQVIQAKDGRDALDQLQRGGAIPELIICDVEMTRLDGFDFLSQRRANSTWSQIPTVMLTSRGNQKHRTLAKHLGATDYFTKPYIEKEFVNAIAKLLQQNP